MPAITELSTSAFSGEYATTPSVELERSGESLTRRTRHLRSISSAEVEFEIRLTSPQSKKLSPPKRKSPRRSINSTANSSSTVMVKEFDDMLTTSSASQPNKYSDELPAELRWNPRDLEQIRAVKEALHASTMLCNAVCRKDEQAKVLELWKLYVEQERSGSLYVCGCPRTGKTMVMEKVKHSLANWSK